MDLISGTRDHPGDAGYYRRLVFLLQVSVRLRRDDRFNADNILAAMRQAGIRGPLDGVIYRIVIPRMKKGLIERSKKLELFFGPGYPPFGPGRVNTFDTFKYDQFAYYYKAHGQQISPEEIFGTVDFPSVWNEAAREGLRLREKHCAHTISEEQLQP
jgi:hypothetical protein